MSEGVGSRMSRVEWSGVNPSPARRPTPDARRPTPDARREDFFHTFSGHDTERVRRLPPATLPAVRSAVSRAATPRACVLGRRRRSISRSSVPCGGVGAPSRTGRRPPVVDGPLCRPPPAPNPAAGGVGGGPGALAAAPTSGAVAGGGPVVWLRHGLGLWGSAAAPCPRGHQRRRGAGGGRG